MGSICSKSQTAVEQVSTELTEDKELQKTFQEKEPNGIKPSTPSETNLARVLNLSSQLPSTIPDSQPAHSETVHDGPGSTLSTPPPPSPCSLYPPTPRLSKSTVLSRQDSVQNTAPPPPPPPPTLPVPSSTHCLRSTPGSPELSDTPIQDPKSPHYIPNPPAVVSMEVIPPPPPVLPPPPINDGDDLSFGGELSDFSEEEIEIPKKKKVSYKPKKTEPPVSDSKQSGKPPQKDDDNVKTTNQAPSTAVTVTTEDPELQKVLNYLQKATTLIGQFTENDALEKTMSMPAKQAFEKIGDLFFELNDSNERKLAGDSLAKNSLPNHLKLYMDILTSNGQHFPCVGFKFDCIQTLALITMTYSDGSSKMCDELGRSGYLVDRIKDLIHLKDLYTDNMELCWYIKTAMSVVYNCARRSNNIKYFRQTEDAVKTILQYTKMDPQGEMEQIVAMSYLTLAYIVDEEHMDMIMAEEDIIHQITLMMKGSLTAPDHVHQGYSTTELLEGLTKLANHKGNSEKIMRANIAPSLIRLLVQFDDVKEKVAAAKLIWVLAFSDENRTMFVEKHAEIVDVLKKLQSDTSSTKLRNTASGALFQLNIDIKNVDPEKSRSASAVSHAGYAINGEVVESDKDLKHVMISYQWDHQEIMIRIKDELELANYKVWMDIQEMGGSTLQSMAEAVENSAVILVCMSHAYKDSVSCRTEAEYAYQKKKDVIPIKLEQDYQPDGWLGAMIGAKLYFNFTIPSKFKTVMTSLIKEIGGRGLKAKGLQRLATSKSIALEGNVTAVADPQSEHHEVNNRPSFKTWTVEEVQKWLSTNNIKALQGQDLDGEVISFLKRLNVEAPEFFYRYLSDQMGLKNIRDLMNFVKALEELF